MKKFLVSFLISFTFPFILYFLIKWVFLKKVANLLDEEFDSQLFMFLIGINGVILFLLHYYGKSDHVVKGWASSTLLLLLIYVVYFFGIKGI